MSEQLYRKTMKGSRTIYQPVIEEPITRYDLSDAQLLTVAGCLGVTLLCLFERQIPPHKRNARKIKAVQDAVVALYKDQAESFDPAIGDWVCQCWDKAVNLAEFPVGVICGTE